MCNDESVTTNYSPHITHPPSSIINYQLPHNLQGGVLEDNRPYGIVAIEPHVHAGVVAGAVALDDGPKPVLGVTHTRSRMVRILAVLVVHDARAARGGGLHRGRDLDRIAVDDALVVLADGRGYRSRTVVAPTVTPSGRPVGTAV